MALLDLSNKKLNFIVYVVKHLFTKSDNTLYIFYVIWNLLNEKTNTTHVIYENDYYV